MTRREKAANKAFAGNEGDEEREMKKDEGKKEGCLLFLSVCLVHSRGKSREEGGTYRASDSGPPQRIIFDQRHGHIHRQVTARLLLCVSRCGGYCLLFLSCLCTRLTIHAVQKRSVDDETRCKGFHSTRSNAAEATGK